MYMYIPVLYVLTLSYLAIFLLPARVSYVAVLARTEREKVGK